MSIVSYKLCMRGLLHQKGGESYSDYFAWWGLFHGRAVVMAGGMDGAAHAARGSRCAGRAAGKHLSHSAPPDSGSPSGQRCASAAIVASLAAANNALACEAHAMGCSVADLRTTLMAVSYEGPDRRPLCYGYVGDGALIVRYADDSVEILEAPQQRVGGGTYSVDMTTEAWRFGTRYGVHALLMSTGGLRDAFAQRDGCGVWHPTPLAARLLEAPQPKEELDALLGATSGTDTETQAIWASTEDRTVYLAWWQPEG